MSAGLRDQIRKEIQSIIGYSCETAAPNQRPTTEFITDRWMQPRLDALVEYVMLSAYGMNDDAVMS